MNDNELMALARRCVQDRFPVYELALALVRSRGEGIGAVMFGSCHDETSVRLLLKDAEYKAGCPPELRNDR